MTTARRLLLALLTVTATIPAIVPTTTPAAARVDGAAPSAHRTWLPDPVPCPDCYRPALRTSWQWQLQGRIRMDVEVALYDVDGFETSARTVRRLHDRGRHVICYLSAGAWERWRPDAGRFPRSVLGRSNGWPGERWLDVRRRGALAPIMKDRLDMCAHKGFDAVEFDNVDAYANRSGFELTGADQLRYNVFLANHAHRRGMSAVLKNDLRQVRRLLPYFDIALNEQCHQYRECRLLEPFVDAGKAVFGVEYRLARREFCPRAEARGFNFLKKRLALGAWRRPCRAPA